MRIALDSYFSRVGQYLLTGIPYDSGGLEWWAFFSWIFDQTSTYSKAIFIFLNGMTSP